MIELLTFLLIALSSTAFATEPRKVKDERRCPESHYFVKAHFRKGYVRQDGTRVQSTNVSGSCRPKSAAFVFWNHLLESKLPKNWPYKKELSKAWSEDEKERFFDAVSILPEELWSKTLRSIVRGVRSTTANNPATRAKNIIVLYDHAFHGGMSLPRVLAHELSHEIFDTYSRREQDSYRLAVGSTMTWEGDEFVWVRRKSGYVEPDGEIETAEDFANNLEYFLFEPGKLKSITPSAYSWFYKKYGDKMRIRTETPK